FLLDGEHQPFRIIIPINFPFVDCDERDTGSAEGINPVSGIQGIEPTETILVPAQHRIEFTVAGVLTHSQERFTVFGVVPADTFVHIFTHGAEAVLLLERGSCYPLVGYARILLGVRAAQIDSRAERVSVTLSLSHDLALVEGKRGG